MSDRLETAIAELSGIHICDAPGCFRQLRPSEGRRVPAGDRVLRTCFSASCSQWASDRMRISETA